MTRHGHRIEAMLGVGDVELTLPADETAGALRVSVRPGRAVEVPAQVRFPLGPEDDVLVRLEVHEDYGDDMELA